MTEHDHDDLDPALRGELRELDYEHAELPPGLRDRTLAAVRAQPGREERRSARRDRRVSRPVLLGGALSVAAVAILALLLVVVGFEGSAPREVDLRGSAGALTAEVRDAEVTLQGDGAPLPAGAEYELWAVQGDPADPQLTSVGTFRPDAEGAVDAELMLPKGMPENVPLAVTREDDDDPAPNLPPVLATA